MDINQIEAFVAVARLKSFSKATEELHLSQPAISRRISLLEHRLGSALFERLPNGILLTESGALFLPYAKRVLASLQDGIEALKSQEEIDKGVVEVALVGTLASTDLTMKLKAFRKKYPEVKLKIRTALSHEVSELVLTGEVTIGLRYFPDLQKDLSCEPFCLESMVPVGSAELATGDQIDLSNSKLENSVWFTFPKATVNVENSFYQLIHNQLEKSHIAGVQLENVDSLSAQKRLIEAGLGFGILPVSSIQEELKLGSLKRMNKPELETTIPVVLITRKTAYLNRAQENFIAEITRDK